MVNLGIDFGSTYTTVSVFKDGRPETKPENSRSFSYPSLVAYDEEEQKYYYGSGARNRIGKPHIKIYRGFKMLLNQQMEEQELLERGYDSEHTPEEITYLFLKYVIDNTLNKMKQDKVGILILGAPECWFRSFRTADGRDALRTICSRMSDRVEKVRIISEPTCAAAFCVWNHERNHGEFNGNILVIDYGGGTLDTAMVSVSHYGSKLKIKPEERSGAGENHDGKLGEAGIAYQETVLKKAVSYALSIPSDRIKYTESFSEALKDLEDTLISDCDIIDEEFEDNLLDPDGLNKQMTKVRYEGQEISITYQMLKESYEEVIEPVLNRVLDETVGNVQNTDEIYVALVGGFCNFYLVRKQIEDYFGMGHIGTHIRSMLHPEDEREKAISYGTALFAEDIIDLSYVAEYGIGMFSIDEDGVEYISYAIRRGQEYTPGEPNFVVDDSGQPVPVMLIHKDRFILNFSANPNDYYRARPINGFSDRLNECRKVSVIPGFSFDENEQISVHLYDYINTPEYQGPSEKPLDVIHLKTLRESFENTVKQRRKTEDKA